MKNSKPTAVMLSKNKFDNKNTLLIKIADKFICVDINEEDYLYILENSEISFISDDKCFIHHDFFD